MNRNFRNFYLIPYVAWIILFVVAPIVLIAYYAFFDVSGNFTFKNFYRLLSPVYLKMMLTSFWYAILITFVSLVVSYPAAFLLSKMKRKKLWILLIILPSWINLLLKTYAFIGLLNENGPVKALLKSTGFGSTQLLFTSFSVILVAIYIYIPFMLMPIFNAFDELDGTLVEAANDLGANSFAVFKRVYLPLTVPGMKAGIQAVFIPSLSIFMITRLIGGNHVITLGTAIQANFLDAQDWGMGSAIAVFLVIVMALVMIFLGSRKVGNSR